MIKKIFLMLLVMLLVAPLFFNYDVSSKSKKSKKKKTPTVRYVKPSIPVEILGSISHIEGKKITFYLGQVDGIKTNDVLPIIKRGKKIGRIKVIWVGKNFSLGNLLTEGIVRVGDLISNIPTFKEDKTKGVPEKIPEKIPEKPIPLRGKIYLIHSKLNVEINLGTEHGVENDSILDVIRGNKNIGKIQIIRAGLFSSTGKIISVEKDEAVLRGDTVIFLPK